jgi:hypothetical protein
MRFELATFGMEVASNNAHCQPKGLCGSTNAVEPTATVSFDPVVSPYFRTVSVLRTALANAIHTSDVAASRVQPWALLPVNLMPKGEMKKRRRVKGSHGVLAARNPTTSKVPSGFGLRIDARQ